jgi:hypothetical protein
MYEYSFAQGNFMQIQAKVSELSQDGWRVVGFTSGNPNDVQMFVILERAKPKAEHDDVIILGPLPKLPELPQK